MTPKAEKTTDRSQVAKIGMNKMNTLTKKTIIERDYPPLYKGPQRDHRVSEYISKRIDYYLDRRFFKRPQLLNLVTAAPKGIPYRTPGMRIGHLDLDGHLHTAVVLQRGKDGWQVADLTDPIPSEIEYIGSDRAWHSYENISEARRIALWHAAWDVELAICAAEEENCLQGIAGGARYGDREVIEKHAEDLIDLCSYRQFRLGERHL